MPLILAIEPDRRQAAQLSDVIGERLGAELVLAASAEEALETLGDRVPDLVLTSALLSTKDETVLADRLRELDAAAAHVQTLTIPVLGMPRPRSTVARGMLSALLRDRGQPSAAPDACDPTMFAEQCAAYLARAASECSADHEDQIAAPPETPVMPEATELLAFPPSDEPNSEIDLSPLLDALVVEQLTAALEAVAATPNPPVGPGTVDGVRTAASPVTPPAARARTRRVRPRRLAGADVVDPEHCSFATLIAQLDEITRMASSLPPSVSSVGSPDASL